METVSSTDCRPAAPVQPAHSSLPTTFDLEAGLTSILGRTVTVLERARCEGQSTFPIEAIRCHTERGDSLKLLCKYDCECESHTAGRHRGGVAYEAQVYRHVLDRLGQCAPGFYGAQPSDGTRRGYLVIEYIEGVQPLNHASAPAEDLVRAATWLGGFHRKASQLLNESTPCAILKAYDEAYYAQWPGRVGAFAHAWRQRLPWLEPLCAQAAACLGAAGGGEPTIIHGEFTPHNILVGRSSVYPVDWEAAAIAPGAIDLVCLTDGWPDSVTALCDQAYRDSRWPSGAPADLDTQLEWARLYLHFRWLGGVPELIADFAAIEVPDSRIEQLRSTAARLGLPCRADATRRGVPKAE